MKPRRWPLVFCLALALGAIGGVLANILGPWVGAQEPADITQLYAGVFGKSTIPAGTSEIRFEITTGIPNGTLIGRLTPAQALAGAPLSIPPIAIQARACNSVGCSALSPNAYQLFRYNFGDVTRDGVVNVSDIVAVNICIFRPETC